MPKKNTKNSENIEILEFEFESKESEKKEE